MSFEPGQKSGSVVRSVSATVILLTCAAVVITHSEWSLLWHKPTGHTEGVETKLELQIDAP